MPYETPLGFLGKVLSGDGAASMVCRNDVAIPIIYAVFYLVGNQITKQKVILPIVFYNRLRISFGASGTRK